MCVAYDLRGGQMWLASSPGFPLPLHTFEPTKVKQVGKEEESLVAKSLVSTSVYGNQLAMLRNWSPHRYVSGAIAAI